MHAKLLCKDHYKMQGRLDKKKNRINHELIAKMSVEELVEASTSSTGNKVYDSSKLGNVEKFFLLFNFTAGKVKVPRQIIYDIYCHWSKDPETLAVFNVRADKSLHRLANQDFYMMEEACLHPWIEAGSVTIENGIAKYTEQYQEEFEEDS